MKEDQIWKTKYSNNKTKEEGWTERGGEIKSESDNFA